MQVQIFGVNMTPTDWIETITAFREVFGDSAVDMSIHEHRLVARTAYPTTKLKMEFLEEYGWHYNKSLNVYTR